MDKDLNKIVSHIIINYIKFTGCRKVDYVNIQDIMNAKFYNCYDKNILLNNYYLYNCQFLLKI